MRALVKFLRLHAVGVVIYLDDLAFVVEGSRAAALRARDFVERTLQSAGLSRHPSKGQFADPSQVLHDHLGYEVNLTRTKEPRVTYRHPPASGTVGPMA